MSAIPPTDPIASVASNTLPKPVAPAAALQQPPAAALDPLTTTEGGFLAQAKETILPIVEKVQTTAKPYTDAAAVKAQELVNRIEGTAQTTGTPSDATRGVNAPAGTTAAPGTGPTAAEKAQGMFAQVQSAVTSTFQQVTNTIETRTTTESHPGLITQVTNAVHKGQEKIEAFLDQPVSGQQPAVQTTTNSVPHPISKEDPIVAPGIGALSGQPAAIPPTSSAAAVAASQTTI